MAIRWSAVKVSEAMDQVELQLSCAQPFIDQALAAAKEARRISHLAGYMDDRLKGLEFYMREKWDGVKSRVQSVRKAIPEGAIEEERENTKHGSTQPLM